MKATVVCFQQEKHGYLVHNLSDKPFNDAVVIVNRVLSSLHGGSLEISHTNCIFSSTPSSLTLVSPVNVP